MTTYTIKNCSHCVFITPVGEPRCQLQSLSLNNENELVFDSEDPLIPDEYFGPDAPINPECPLIEEPLIFQIQFYRKTNKEKVEEEDDDILI